MLCMIHTISHRNCNLFEQKKEWSWIILWNDFLYVQWASPLQTWQANSDLYRFLIGSVLHFLSATITGERWLPVSLACSICGWTPSETLLVCNMMKVIYVRSTVKRKYFCVTRERRERRKCFVSIEAFILRDRKREYGQTKKAKKRGERFIRLSQKNSI